MAFKVQQFYTILKIIPISIWGYEKKINITTLYYLARI